MAKIRREESVLKLREVQNNDRQYRDEMLEELAKKKAAPWNMTSTSALKVLKEAENTQPNI